MEDVWEESKEEEDKNKRIPFHKAFHYISSNIRVIFNF